MNDLLELDLNDIVTKKIKKEIEFLNEQLKSSRKKNYKLVAEIEDSKKEIKNSDNIIFLFNYLKKQFSKIKEGEHDTNNWYDSKQKNQYIFIKKILSNFFNVKQEYNGWLSHRNDGQLKVNLAVNYYSNKQIVINLLKILMDDYYDKIIFIETFKMPFDYTKDEVIKYVEAPRYNTNGCIYGISEYWINTGAGKSCMPHDLIMKNPYILEEDIFKLLIKTIKEKRGEYYYLFALPQYNNNITQKQINQLGECLLVLDKTKLKYNPIQQFIIDNLKIFNTKTLNFLYKFISSNNQFKTFDWQKFPNEYQMKFLKKKNIEEVLKIIMDYTCTWTLKEKEDFLKDYLKNKGGK
jgi:hypothetical protein